MNTTIQTSLPPAQQALQARCLHPTGPFQPFQLADLEQSIATRFEQQVEMHADRIALTIGAQQWTYAALNRVANQIAHAILARCGMGPEPVGILCEQSPLAIAAVLGILKAGKFYVPLDPAYPEARLVAILADAQVALVLTNDRQQALVKALNRQATPTLNLDQLDAHRATDNPGLHILPETPLGIFYTSGSTGAPKGVLTNQRGLLYHIMAYTNAVHISPHDHLTLLHSLSFRAVALHLFGALLNGAELWPYDVKKMGLVPLASWLRQAGITLYHSVPLIFRQLADTVHGSLICPTLRLIHLSGAPVTHQDVELYKQCCSTTCLFLHRMGVTEGQTVRWMFIDQDSPLGGSTLPVGYPVAEIQVLLLDDDGRQVDTNAIGEITIKSDHLALGYWRQSALTRAAFRSDGTEHGTRLYRTGDLGRMQPDGCLEHLGRKDFQVKIRGHRVEVAEIELALMLHQEVKAAVVRACPGQGGGRLSWWHTLFQRDSRLHPAPNFDAVSRRHCRTT